MKEFSSAEAFESWKEHYLIHEPGDPEADKALQGMAKNAECVEDWEILHHFLNDNGHIPLSSPLYKMSTDGICFGKTREELIASRKFFLLRWFNSFITWLSVPKNQRT